MQSKNVQPRFNLSTRVVNCDIGSIPSLAGKKKSYPNVKPRVDCWKNINSSAKSKVGRENVNVCINILNEENAISKAQLDRDIEQLAAESSDSILIAPATLLDTQIVSENRDLPDKVLNEADEIVTQDNCMEIKSDCVKLHYEDSNYASGYGTGTDSKNIDLSGEESNSSDDDYDCYYCSNSNQYCYSEREDSTTGSINSDEFDFRLPSQTNIIYISPLPGKKKSYRNVRPRVDCWNKIYPTPR